MHIRFWCLMSKVVHDMQGTAQNGQASMSTHSSGISLNAMDEDDHLLLDSMVCGCCSMLDGAAVVLVLAALNTCAMSDMRCVQCITHGWWNPAPRVCMRSLAGRHHTACFSSDMSDCMCCRRPL